MKQQYHHRKEVTLSAEMGAEVMRLLSDYVDVEALRQSGQGVVAGQAVASAVQDLYFGGRGGVYNDVDWFAHGTPEEVEAYGKEKTRRRINTVAHVASTLIPDNYAVLTLDTLTRYKVLSSRREGMLNRVAVNPITRCVAHDVLASFDFNCVQVGVDMESGSLVWTRQFEEFLSTRQLELASLHTPWHSAIRYFKKLVELQDVYGDDARVMETMIAANGVYRMLGRQKAAEQRWLFGPKAAAEYRQYEAQLSRWFDLKCRPAESKGSPDIYELTPKLGASEKLVQTLKPFSGAPQLSATVARAVLTKRKAAVSERLQRILTLPCLAYYWADSTSPGYTPLEQLAAEQHAVADLKALDRMVQQHGQLSVPFARTGLTGGIKLMGVLNEFAHAHGRWVVGLAEQQCNWWGIRDTEWSSETLEAKLRFELTKLIPEEIEHRSKVLAPRMLPEGFRLEGVRIRNLITRGELVDEGEELHHCVGGYGGAVAAGGVVLSLRCGPKPTHWSTAELRWDRRYGRFAVAQHRGPCNGVPHETNARALQQLVASRVLEKARLGWLLGSLPASSVSALYSTRRRVEDWVGRVRWAYHRWDTRQQLRAVKGGTAPDLDIPF